MIKIEMFSKFIRSSFHKSLYYIVLHGNEQMIRGKDYRDIKKIEHINFVQNVRGLEIQNELKQGFTK